MILDEGLRMLTALTLANLLSDKTEALAEASGRLDALRITLRLAKRLGKRLLVASLDPVQHRGSGGVDALTG